MCSLLDRYPIIPSFQDWEFPHNRIPDSWPQVSTSPPTRRCAISNFSFSIDGAHLVPQEEALWYQRNDMRRYGDAVLCDIDNSTNIIPLKTDLLRCFDNRWFAIIPKVMKTTIPHSPQYVTHILRREAVELWPTYQNIIVQYLDGKARPYLFARFAWAILLQVKPFITDDLPRHVIRIKISDEDKIEYQKELLSGPQLKAYYGGGGSKGATPKNKRSRTDSRADDEESDVNMDNDWEDMMSGWQQQGKKRRKQISSETVVEEDNQAHQLAELKTRLEEILPGGGDNIPEQA
jgi:HNH endonuclease